MDRAFSDSKPPSVVLNWGEYKFYPCKFSHNALGVFFIILVSSGRSVSILYLLIAFTWIAVFYGIAQNEN
ncbi:hypothetical protein SynBIOSE41_02050 [Synechococcus sp. BIOS-E4-1]|nr:hypothetical protein SynBIOSE41_02050 [Synechococcus sp. BIOS-E4-1]